MRGRVAGMRADCLLERILRGLVLALRGIEHGQIVVGLRQFGVILGQAGEDRDGIVGLALVGQDQAFEESGLRVLGVFRQIAVGPFECAGEIALAELLVDFLDFAGPGRDSDDGQAKCGGGEDSGQGHMVCSGHLGSRHSNNIVRT